MENLYYIAPPDAQFEELKARAIELWAQYDDTHNYASNKIERVKRKQNFEGNFMEIVAMFDYANASKLAKMLTPETRAAVRERLIAGGSTFIVF